jgi:hypothetical protein
MKDDEEFKDMMKACWGLSDHAPAPPLYKLRHTAGLSSAEYEVPIAIQSHGDCITWTQDQSLLEKQAREMEAQKGRKVRSVVFWSFIDTGLIFDECVYL